MAKGKTLRTLYKLGPPDWGDISREDKILKNFSAKSTLLTLLAFSFVALFAVGCGDSRDDFVNTTTNNNNNGNLVFRFQQAVTQTTVPNGTATLRFDFFSTDPGTAQSLLFTETRPFATEVRFDNVSSQVASVAVTSFGADGLPTQTNVAAVTVVVGNDVAVDLNQGTVASFDALTGPGTVNLVSDADNMVLLSREGTLNQLSSAETAQLILTGTFTPGGDFDLPINDTVATFSFADNNVANISSTGLLTGFNFGANTTLTANYTALSTTRSTDVAIQTFFYAIGDASTTIPTNLTDGSIIGVVSFINKRGIFTNVRQTPNTTYTLGTPVLSGVSIDSTTGEVTTGSTTGTQDVIVTYVDPDSGLTFTDTHTVTVSDTAN